MELNTEKIYEISSEILQLLRTKYGKEEDNVEVNVAVHILVAIGSITAKMVANTQDVAATTQWLLNLIEEEKQRVVTSEAAIEPEILL